MSACRSCGAEIIWGLTVTGKRMPLDAQPGGGTISLDDGIVTVLTGLDVVAYDGPLYTSHFATCPNASQHRKEAR